TRFLYRTARVRPVSDDLVLDLVDRQLRLEILILAHTRLPEPGREAIDEFGAQIGVPDDDVLRVCQVANRLDLGKLRLVIGSEVFNGPFAFLVDSVPEAHTRNQVDVAVPR